MSKHIAICKYYKLNENTEWTEWLEFNSLLKSNGNQGVVGLFRTKTDAKHLVVFKFSQTVDYAIEHETRIYNQLRGVSSFCPNFPKHYGSITCNTNIDSATETPFTPVASHMIPKRVLLSEYIKGYQLNDYIRNPKIIRNNSVFACIKQLMIALHISQMQARFTHYDLHPCNVIVKPCDTDVVLLYVLDDSNQIAVPTRGHLPVIIDYGYSHTKNTGGYLTGSLAHTNVGFHTYTYDWFTDARMFLLSTTNEMVKHRNNKHVKKLRSKVMDMCSAFPAEHDSGWCHSSSSSIIEHIGNLVVMHNSGSILFANNMHHCLEIIQTIVILPIEKQNFRNIQSLYSVFIREWKHIEDQMLNTQKMLHMLKCVVEAAKAVHGDYISKSTRYEAVRLFRNKVSEDVDSFINYCNLKSVNWEIMLCSLLELGRSMEGIIYIRTIDERTTQQHDKEILKVSNMLDMYAHVDSVVSDNYTYNSNTKIIVVNAVNNTNDVLQLAPEYIRQVNKIHSHSRGAYIYDTLVGPGCKHEATPH